MNSRQLLTYATGGAAAFALAPRVEAAVPTRPAAQVARARIRAVPFDSYGTLFDVDSLAVLSEKLYPGKGVELSQLWRRKQIEYSWLRTLLRRYQDFAAVTEDGLVFATNKLKLELTIDKTRAAARAVCPAGRISRRHRRHQRVSQAPAPARHCAEPIEELGVPIINRGTTLFDAARYVREAMA